MSWVYRAVGSLRWAGEGRGNSKKRGKKKGKVYGQESWLGTEKKVER